jgi:putative transposase
LQAPDSVPKRYQPSERALVAALAEMCVQGGLDAQGEGNHRTVVRPQFFGRVDQRDQQRLAQFAGRSLAEAFPYLIPDARYERVREAGVISSRSMPIAIGIDRDGRRQMLAVELARFA